MSYSEEIILLDAKENLLIISQFILPETEMSVINKNFDALDLTKFILAIVIVTLHTKLLPYAAIPVQRLAVPLFFIISSFLFWWKDNQYSFNEKTCHLRRFVVRSASLYLFWLIALFPITMDVRQSWFSASLSEGVVRSVFNLFFGSTFMASWFISALVLGMILVWWMLRHMPRWVVLIVAVSCFILSYVTGIWMKPDLYWKPYNSFPIAIAWIVCGSLLAESRNVEKVSRKIHIVGLIVSIPLLWAEWYVVGIKTGVWCSDVYLMLVPVVWFLAQIIVGLNVHLRYSRVFRSLGVLIYVLHFSVFYRVACKLSQSGYPPYGVLAFVITLLLTLIIAISLQRLSTVHGFKWLCYGM